MNLFQSLVETAECDWCNGSRKVTETIFDCDYTSRANLETAQEIEITVPCVCVISRED